jgi:hypothetical protein
MIVKNETANLAHYHVADDAGTEKAFDKQGHR